MKKKPKPKPKPMTTITRVKALEIQTALTDARTYEHADQLKRIGGQFDKLAKIVAADFQTHTRRIVEINERLPDKAQVADFVNLQKRINELSEQLDPRFTETVRDNLLRAPLRMDTFEMQIDRLIGSSTSQYDWLKSLEDRANSLSKRESELFSALQSIGERLKALEHLSGIRCNVPAEPTPGWQKIVTLGTIIIPKPSLWKKFKRFLGF